MNVMLTGVCMIAITFGFLGLLLRLMSNAGKAGMREVQTSHLKRFYKECNEQGYSDFSQPKNVAKAQLLADKLNLKYPDGIQALYQSSMQADKTNGVSTDRNTSEEEERLIELCEAIQRQYDQQERFASLRGRNKRRVLLNRELERARRYENRYHNQINSMRESVLRPELQEKDWAVSGGLANGLAGPAAGLATAANVQADNLQIRERNLQIRKENERRTKELEEDVLYRLAVKNWFEEKKNCENIEKELKELDLKLLGELPSDEVMELIDISDLSIHSDESGRTEISATVSPKSQLFIFGDVPAVVDGYLIAHVFMNGREVSSANLVFPSLGIGGETRLNGLLPILIKGDNNKEVTITEGKLWLIEK